MARLQYVLMVEQVISVGKLRIGRGQAPVLIAGPCVIESHEHTLRLAEQIERVCRTVGMPVIFKASFDKANRSSSRSFRGPGLEEGLRTLAAVRERLGVPILSDIHLPEQAGAAGEVLDVVQIPAFLCRQTDLLLAAGAAGRCVNVKKGQFMSPEEMGNVVEKVCEAAGTKQNDRVLLTERGTFFGYNRLVNDLTGIARMQRFAPVVFDATHSCQQPGGLGTQSGGQREFAPLLARSAMAAGADALFLEVHDDPDQAKSDPATVWPLAQLEALLRPCLEIARVVRQA